MAPVPPLVLVIEDNAANLELVVYLLSAAGYRTAVAENGVDGIRIAHETKPDLIVCDIDLPDIDGFEVVRRFKSDPAVADIPVIAVTAFAMVGDREKAVLAGFDGHMTKPIEPDSFVARLGTFLRAPHGHGIGDG